MNLHSATYNDNSHAPLKARFVIKTFLKRAIKILPTDKKVTNQVTKKLQILRVTSDTSHDILQSQIHVMDIKIISSSSLGCRVYASWNPGKAERSGFDSTKWHNF